jgi:IS30 family transposase
MYNLIGLMASIKLIKTIMSYKHFTQDDRNEISILLKNGYSHRDIAGALGKNHSSVSREIKNNSVNGIYDSKKAQTKSRVKRSKSKYQRMEIVKHSELIDYMKIHLSDDHHWTPEEIAGGWNNENHLNNSGKKIIISAPSIYKYLYSAYGQHLCKYLCSKRHTKRKRKTGGKAKRQLIPNRKSIEERPDVINKRIEFGHWEGDTLGRIKTDTEAVVGLSEGMSRFILIDKVPILKYSMNGFKMLLNPHHDTFFKSLTMDNGVENVRYEELNVDTYFCHPYSLWEKGGVENLFKRLRRFIPKKASLKDYSRKNIIGFAEIMNNTPRKCLNWKTPREVFEEQCELNNIKINLDIYSKALRLTI